MVPPQPTIFPYDKTSIHSSSSKTRFKTWLWPWSRSERSERGRNVGLEDAWSRGDCRWMPDERPGGSADLVMAVFWGKGRFFCSPKTPPG